MSTFDPQAFDRWLTTQPDDSIERGQLEDTLAAKIKNMFDEVNVALPEHVLATAVTYAADLAEAYVAEVTINCEKCGREIDEHTSAADRVDPSILTCGPGFGCQGDPWEPDLDETPEWGDLRPVPPALVGLLVAGLQRLVIRDDKRAEKGKPRLLSPYEYALIRDGVGIALTPGFSLHYEV